MLDQSVPVRVPRLRCPAPPAVHPAVARLEESAIAWMRRFGFIRDSREEEAARRAQFGRLAALTYPHASVEGAQLACDWMIWLFLQDDEYMERAAVAGRPMDYARHTLRCLRVLHDPDAPPGDDPYIRALHELCARTGAQVGPEHYQRFLSGLHEYFTGAGAEVLYLCHREIPSLEEYIALRESSIALRSVMFVLLESGTGCPLPGSRWGTAEIQAVALAASRVNSWINDILSGLRELHWPGAINLITVLARHHGCTPVEAIGKAVEYHDRELDAFLVLSERLRRTSADPHLARYLDGLAAWTRGNRDWSLTCGRYHVDNPDLGVTGPQHFGE
ncbi:hypothetical protein CTZ27_33590 [Streptomyces griseocarneus]|nr:hypothetical protein CTZ27_33590 [Streptomyces griseocarneus]